MVDNSVYITGLLSEGKRGAVARSTEVAEYIIEHPTCFLILLEQIQKGDEVCISHASHALATIGKLSPGLVSSHSTELTQLLLKQRQWEFIEAFSKILSILTLSNEQALVAFDVLETVFRSGKASLERVWALQALYDIALMFPECRERVEGALKVALHSDKKAVQARARRLMQV